MTRLVSTALLVLAAGGGPQDAQRHGLPPPDVVMPAEGARLPLAFHGGRPVVEARVNGKGPYRFYFDTGASGPVMGQKLARELGLRALGAARVKSGGDGPDAKLIEAEVVNLDLVELGGARLMDMRVVAMDRGRLGDADAPEGVFSPASFPGFLVTLDYPRKELRLRRGKLGAP